MAEISKGKLLFKFKKYEILLNDTLKVLKEIDCVNNERKKLMNEEGITLKQAKKIIKVKDNEKLIDTYLVFSNNLMALYDCAITYDLFFKTSKITEDDIKEFRDSFIDYLSNNYIGGKKESRFFKDGFKEIINDNKYINNDDFHMLLKDNFIETDRPFDSFRFFKREILDIEFTSIMDEFEKIKLLFTNEISKLDFYKHTKIENSLFEDNYDDYKSAKIRNLEKYSRRFVNVYKLKFYSLFIGMINGHVNNDKKSDETDMFIQKDLFGNGIIIDSRSINVTLMANRSLLRLPNLLFNFTNTKDSIVKMDRKNYFRAIDSTFDKDIIEVIVDNNGRYKGIKINDIKKLRQINNKIYYLLDDILRIDDSSKEEIVLEKIEKVIFNEFNILNECFLKADYDIMPKEELLIYYRNFI